MLGAPPPTMHDLGSSAPPSAPPSVAPVAVHLAAASAAPAGAPETQPLPASVAELLKKRLFALGEGVSPHARAPDEQRESPNDVTVAVDMLSPEVEDLDEKTAAQADRVESVKGTSPAAVEERERLEKRARERAEASRLGAERIRKITGYAQREEEIDAVRDLPRLLWESMGIGLRREYLIGVTGHRPHRLGDSAGSRTRSSKPWRRCSPNMRTSEWC